MKTRQQRTAKPVRRLPHIVAYALTDADQTVAILRVIHTSRDWGEEDCSG